MKADFSFDGRKLHIRLDVEETWDEAVAKLMDGLTEAKVFVDYGRDSMYSYRDTKRPKGVDIYLTKPVEPEPEPV